MQDGAAALSRLARLAGGDEPLAAEVLVALQDPQRYLAEHRDRLADRGILEPRPDLAWIALVDGLRDRGLCRELDWREDPVALVQTVHGLLGRRGVTGWQAPGFDEDEELTVVMGLVDASLAPVGFSLVALDIRSDGYPVVLLPAAEAAAAAELAGTAGLGQVLRFGT